MQILAYWREKPICHFITPEARDIKKANEQWQNKFFVATYLRVCDDKYRVENRYATQNTRAYKLTHTFPYIEV